MANKFGTNWSHGLVDKKKLSKSLREKQMLAINHLGMLMNNVKIYMCAHENRGRLTMKEMTIKATTLYKRDLASMSLENECMIISPSRANKNRYVGSEFVSSQTCRPRHDFPFIELCTKF